MAERVLIALGSNVGDRPAYLAGARTAVASLPATRLVAASRVEETAPFGAGAQGPYLNQMILVHSALAPRALLAQLQRIERALGRVRHRRWGARTIDLDIVRMGTVVLQSADLVLPHPGLPERAFWREEIDELMAMLEQAA